MKPVRKTMNTPAPPKLGNVIDVDPAWVAKVTEAALEPELPIVDPHHHLWQRAGNDYMFHDLLADTRTGHKRRRHGVRRLPFDVSQGRPTGAALRRRDRIRQTAWRRCAPSGLYGDLRACAAIVSHVDLRLGAKAGAAFDAQIAAGNGRFIGIRYQTGLDKDPRNPPDPHQPDARPDGRQDLAGKVFRELDKRGLAFDSWTYHPQLAEVGDLAAAFPNTQIVLDHVGGPLGYASYASRHDEVFATWKKSMAELARRPNITVKVGRARHGDGLVRFLPAAVAAQLADAGRRLQALGRDLHRAVSAPIAACFESNFPVDKITSGYGVLWNAFKRLSAKASAAEKTALFSGTAARVYKLDLSTR